MSKGCYLPDLGVHTGTDGTQVLDDRDLGTESRPDGTELQTDDTATNDDHLGTSAIYFLCDRSNVVTHLLWDLLEVESTSGADDPLLVNLDTGER